MQKTINLQDSFLNSVRRDKSQVTVFLVNGFQLRGVVRGFDSFVVLLDSEGQTADDLQARHFHPRARQAGGIRYIRRVDQGVDPYRHGGSLRPLCRGGRPRPPAEGYA